ncbi:MAG: hypothetical protein GW748_05155 [Alphaproteobacteria bacterium]|nr:hypothetical protein [Alphaproteobacteria bacterium]NCQ67114.1 hypothetical protein [Alphaproteobacteria bacterium]NCT07711.1 hypothetical protein [Alphaproteobacteria bacterium]
MVSNNQNQSNLNENSLYFLNERLVADAFWGFVYKNSLKKTGFPENIKDIPKDLWSRERIIDLLKEYKITLKAEGDLEELIESIYLVGSNIITKHMKEGKNIIGPVYVEDFKECKDPFFNFSHLVNRLKSDSNENCDYLLKLNGDYELSGDFLLRTPLPSVVLLKEEPKKKINIIIPNTEKALGYQKTLILPMQELSTLPNNKEGYKYFATGIFHIPTQIPHDKYWAKLIPNSLCFLEAFNAIIAKGQIVKKKKKKDFFKNAFSRFFKK